MRNKLKPVIDKYIEGEAARAVALDLTVGLMVMEGLQTQGDRMGPDLAHEALRALVGVYLDLPANPFWVSFQSYLSPIVASSCNAWFDAVDYVVAHNRETDEGKQLDLMLRGMGVRGSIVEVALAVLYCERGAGMLRAKSRAFRDELLKVLEE